jgi:hypothetical protein
LATAKPVSAERGSYRRFEIAAAGPPTIFRSNLRVARISTGQPRYV